MNLNEMQFELLASDYAAAGQVFGIGADISLDSDGFDPGEDEWQTDDVPQPRLGGVAFGRDVLNGPTWNFGMHVNTQDLDGALAALGRMKTAWRAQHIRDTPGAVIPLRYRVGDRYRRAYGRPRRFAAPPQNELMSGYVPITADFACATAYTYDEIENVVTVGDRSEGIGGSTGGMTFPVTLPAVTAPTSTSPKQQLVVGGDAPASPVIRFYGPCNNPSFSGSSGWTLRLNGAIPPGAWVEVDLRPWALTIKNQSGASVPTYLAGHRQYLNEMQLRPGTRPEFQFSTAGNMWSGAKVEIRWRNTWNSI